MLKIKILFTFLFFISFDSNAQEKPKDTLFFNYDQKYILTFTEIPNQYYTKDSGNSGDGAFFLYHEEVKFNLVPKKIYNLKKFVRSSKFYQNKKLKDLKFSDLLSKYEVFLVKKSDQETAFIYVRSGYEIE